MKMTTLEFPTYVELDAKSTDFQIAQCTDFADALLHFEMAIPTNMTQPPEDPSADGESTFKPIARFVNAEKGLKVEVGLHLLAREMSAPDWLEIEMDRQNGKVIESRKLPTSSGGIGDFLYSIEGGDDTSKVVRAMALKDGNRLFAVFVQIDSEKYDEFAEVVSVPVLSFRLLNPQMRSTAEDLAEFRDFHEKVSFRFPSSWVHRTLVEGEKIHISELSNQVGGEEIARILVEVHPELDDHGVSQLVQESVGGLASTGLHVGGAPLIPVLPPEGYESCRLFTTTATLEEYEFDVAILIMELAGFTLLLSLVGTARHHAPEWWAIHRRALEIVRDSLQLRSSV